MESFRMKSLFRTLMVLVSLSPLACTAADNAGQYKLGEHYLPVRAEQPPADPAKIEVMEVFAYSCPHCYALEPALKKWLAKKPGDVAFVRSPHSLGHPENEMRNRAFFAASMLGVQDRFHATLFDAIHKQRRAMATPEEVRGLVVEQLGVKGEAFDGAVNSFAADAGYRRGKQTVEALGVTSVPSLVVEGKYLVSPNLAGGLEPMLKVVDFLVEKARQERAKR
jgi:protein dithiol oxidoreductase (disulfide-forming)